MKGRNFCPFAEAKPRRPARQSRTPQKSFLSLLEEKIRRAQIRKSEENFFAGWRVVASGGGLTSLVGIRLVKSSDFVQEGQDPCDPYQDGSGATNVDPSR